MARGAVSKEKITKQILETFSGSFLYNGGKEIRVPIVEDGEVIQIKVTLTAAKTNVASGEDTAIPGGEINFTNTTNTSTTKEIVEPTAEEKKNVSELLKTLGLA